MKLNSLNFSDEPDYKLLILVKESAFRRREIEQHYVKPLLARGFTFDNIVAVNLPYNTQNKAPVKLIKEYLQSVKIFIDTHNIKYILCADATYFKTLCKVKKAEPHYGYVLPSIWPGVQAALTINYMQLFHNPQLLSNLTLGIDAISNEIKGLDPIFSDKPIWNVAHFPETLEDIQKTLNKLLAVPQLTVDIETFGLTLNDSHIRTIAFGVSEKIGTAFIVYENTNTHFSTIYNALKQFFDNYKGKLIFHKADFDTSRLIYRLYMSTPSDYEGMLEGLETLHRDTEDTLILAYLSLNSTAGNNLDLKALSFEFTGNYAINFKNQITDLKKLRAYNLIDALGTYYIYNKYRPIVKEIQEDIYQTIYKPSSKVITQTSLTGLPFNKSTVKDTSRHLNILKRGFSIDIQQSPIIQEFTQVLRLEAMLSKNKKLKKTKKTIEDFKDLVFNPASGPQLRKLLYEHLNLPVHHYTDTGLPSTDGKALTGLIEHLKREYNIET